jgi:ABC-type uncharacterized transport system ATPase subunit
MPGARLTNLESSMLQRWVAREEGRYPTLRSIKIAPGLNPVGLRGISELEVEFGFPVSVLVGANGSGKTTLLSLAALGYNGDQYSPHGRTRYGYTFVEFFVRTNEEATPLDIHIAWKYSNGEDVEIHRKTTSKWMRYERRIKRPVHFIGLSRIADPSESSTHRRTFASPGGWQKVELKAAVAADLTRILRRPISGADSFSSEKLSLKVLRGESTYSAFNMGTGEAALVEILNVLHSVPAGSLVLIEEVELGIHSAALAELAKTIVRIAKLRDLQVICTSHNEWFIDALPREARVLLTRGASSHSSITGVTTRVALTTLTGASVHQARIICEDELAKGMLEHGMTAEQRRKFQIIPMGADSTLVSAARALRLENKNIPILIVWDCDVTDAEVREYFKSSDISNPSFGDLHLGVEWCRLPGPVDAGGAPSLGTDGKPIPPEEAIRAAILADPETLGSLANHFRLESSEEFESHLKSAALGKGDHHGLFMQLAEGLAISEETVRDAILGEYSRVVDWTPVHEGIRTCIDGDGVGFVPPPIPETKVGLAA